MSKQKLNRADVDVLFTNLRLLLDERDGWGEISAQTLATRDAGPNQKLRIQSAEWILYHLFDIWNPEEAADVRTLSAVISSFTDMLVDRNYDHSFPLSSLSNP